MKFTNVFHRNLKAKSRVVVNQGGTSSSKTYSILQLIYLLATRQNGKIISIVSETMPHLKRGAMRDFFNILITEGVYNEIYHNKSDHIYKINNTIIEFFSADKFNKVLSARRDYLFINECYNINYELYDHLAVRTRERIYLDYNPVSNFWVHDKVLIKDNVTLIKSTYKDNQFLEKNIIDSIESHKNLDANWWRVFGEGEVGQVEGLVFTNIALCDEFPAECKWELLGLDFGFTNDPTAILRVGLHSGELWIDELMFKTGQTNNDIANFLIPFKKTEIIADSAEPKSIEEIRRSGFNIKGVLKCKVSTGIDIMKRYKINITKRSLNTIKEFRNYYWLQNKDGDYTNEPVKKFNHSIDAVRYAVMTKVLIKNKIIDLDVI